MFSVTDRTGPFSQVALEAKDGSSIVEIAPGRGGIVTRFTVSGREILFFDPATLADPRTNVRGGVPVLFPTPGKLTDDRWARDGHAGALKQHGYARSSPWQIVDRREGEVGAVTLRLLSGEAPVEAWPFACHVYITFTLAPRTLRLDIRVANDGPETMPFAFGFHPYFAIADADKPRLGIPTRATRAFDNVKKEIVPFRGFDFAHEVDLHLLDHGESAARLELPDGGRVALEASPEFSHWVVWSLPKRDFVCVEPWTSPGDAMNTGDRLLHVPKGAERSLFFEIRLEA